MLYGVFMVMVGTTPIGTAPSSHGENEKTLSPLPSRCTSDASPPPFTFITHEGLTCNLLADTLDHRIRGLRWFVDDHCASILAAVRTFIYVRPWRFR